MSIQSGLVSICTAKPTCRKTGLRRPRVCSVTSHEACLGNDVGIEANRASERLLDVIVPSHYTRSLFGHSVRASGAGGYTIRRLAHGCVPWTPNPYSVTRTLVSTTVSSSSRRRELCAEEFPARIARHDRPIRQTTILHVPLTRFRLRGLD
jgi:hypothetical protein